MKIILENIWPFIGSYLIPNSKHDDSISCPEESQRYYYILDEVGSRFVTLPGFDSVSTVDEHSVPLKQLSGASFDSCVIWVTDSLPTSSASNYALTVVWPCRDIRKVLTILYSIG